MQSMLKSMRWKCGGWWVMLGVAVYCLATMQAFALGFEVDKVRFNLSLAQPVDSIRVKNTNTGKPVSLQTLLMNWTQVNGEDKYEPTKDLIIAPPVVTVPPNREQIMRIGWRKPGPLKTELAYRVYISELAPIADEKVRIGVMLKLSVGIPIFIAPDSPQTAYTLTARRGGGNAVTLDMRNTGNVHIQLLRLDLLDSQEKVVGSYTKPFYILPQQAKNFQVSLSGYAGGPLKAVAATDSQTLTSVINVS